MKRAERTRPSHVMDMPASRRLAEWEGCLEIVGKCNYPRHIQGTRREVSRGTSSIGSCTAIMFKEALGIFAIPETTLNGNVVESPGDCTLVLAEIALYALGCDRHLSYANPKWHCV